MSVDDGRLFVRVGDLLTSRPESQAVHIRPASLVCLDLRAEGRMLWEREVPGAEWAFDGAPVCCLMSH